MHVPDKAELASSVRFAPGPADRSGAPFAEGTIAGRYQLEGKLGSGGMGSVYRALDQGSGRTVALKLLRSNEPKARDLFRREFRTLAKLAHPCVIRVLEHGEAATGQLYYTMELLGGQDLASAGPLPWLQACEVLRDVASSLALLHSQQLVHRDVNPKNVRLTDDGRAKLLDFGALCPFGASREVIGTPSCIAPETLRGQPHDGRTDLFSLGVVGYWALTGRLPYAIQSFTDAEAGWQTAPLPPSYYVSELPAGIDGLLLSLLSVEPSGRPASAADVIDRLGALAALDDEPLWTLAESHVTSANLVEREAQLSKLQDLLNAAKERHGTLLSIVGERGSGKTRLLRELTTQGQLSGFVTAHLQVPERATSKVVLQGLVRALQECAPRETSAAGSVDLLGSVSDARGAQAPNKASGDHFEHEHTLRTHLQLGQLAAQLATRRPLLITVDDADALSASASGILPILAHACLGRSLLIAVTRGPEHCSAGVEHVESLGETLRLSDLSEPAVDSLLTGIFGDVPNRARLGAWLASAAAGNPGRIRDALVHLLDKRVVRYGGGAWLLPADFSDVPLPQDSGTVSELALASLSLPARELLHVLACHPAPLPLEIAAQLVPEATGASQELATKRLATQGSGGVALAQTALRQTLCARLSMAERRAVHGKLASALSAAHGAQLELLQRNKASALSTAELVTGIHTGLHLLHTGEERRATTLLRNGAVELTVRGEAVAAAVLPLEEAVALYRALGRPLYVYVGLLSTLALAGTYSDWRLNYRYAEDMVRAYTGAAGFRYAERMAPFLGKRVAVFAGLALAFILFLLFPQRRPASSFRTLLLGPAGLGTGALSVCSVMMDPERAERIVGWLRPLGYFPWKHPLRQVHEYQLALWDHARGRYADSRGRAVATLSYLRSEAGRKAFPESARVQLDAGVLIALGQIDACRTDGSVHQTIADIDRVQTSTSRQTYSASWMSYHAHRGERDAYVQWRERTDQLAAAEGSTWRNDIQVPRMVWSSYALCGDVLTLKRDMEQLRLFSSQVPTVARLRDMLSACYLCERGKPEEALALYEDVFREAEHEQGVRAAQRLGAYARILRKAGREREAVAVCERTLARQTPKDLEFEVLVFGVQLELALSLTALGEHQRAKQLLDQWLPHHAAHDNPMLRGLLHHARAEVALNEHDWTTFDQQSAGAQEWFDKTKHPGLLAQQQRQAERARSTRSKLAFEAVVAGASTYPAAVADDASFETEAVTLPR